MLLLVALLQFTKAKSTLAGAWRRVGVKTFRTFLQPWTAVCKEPLFHFVNAGVDFGALQYRIILSEYLSQLGGYFWAVRLRLNEWLAGALLTLEEGCTAAYGRVETSWRRDPSALLVKGKWGEQALWEIELRLESIKVEKKIELDALCIFGDVKYLIWLSSVY